MKQMRQLLWKDYRLNRPSLVLFAAIWVATYIVGVGAQFASGWPKMPTAHDWAGMLVSYGTLTMYVTFCFSGLLGGHAIACERGDRSAHFLACLPPTKMQILTSKLVVAVSAMAVMWGWILLSLYVIAPRLSSEPVDFSGTVVGPGVAAVCVLTFGVGWLASACLEKTTIPIIVALVSPGAVTVALLLVGVVLRIPKVHVSDWSNLACVLTGVIAFLAGSWYYCRRIEP